MTHMNLRKGLRTVVLLGASLTAANVMADPPQWPYYPGYGMGPGMMGGYGMGPGMMGGYGMGPGMMGGYGMGPGPMGGYGMGPGPMAGYGMGPGPMAGYGVGPGMMRGYGMGPGMIAYGMAPELNLTDEQRSQIAKVQEALRQKQTELMGKMQEIMVKMRELFAADSRDDAALSDLYRKMSDVRQEMFNQLLSARKQVDAVFSKAPPETPKAE